MKSFRSSVWAGWARSTGRAILKLNRDGGAQDPARRHGAATPTDWHASAREAQVLAALNHPNIAAIYGMADRDDQSLASDRALVMELVEGATLRRPAEGGP